MHVAVTDLLFAYQTGVFPMAEASGEIYWYEPDPRAIIPIKSYKPARSLRPILNQQRFDVRIDRCFRQVMECCAKPRFEGDETWISNEIIEAYVALHRLNFAHSVEVYQQNELCGGLYGVHLGGAFFGESMFYKVSNASKVAFHYLIEILKANKFSLLDSQFMNDNVARYGAIEIPKSEYKKLLKTALSQPCAFKL